MAQEYLPSGLYPPNTTIYSAETQQYSLFIFDEVYVNPEDQWSSSLGSISSGGIFTAPTTLVPLTGTITYEDSLYLYSTSVYILPLTGSILVVPDIEPTLISSRISVVWDVLSIPNSTGQILLRPLNSSPLSELYSNDYLTSSLNPNTYYIRGFLSLSSGASFLTPEHEIVIESPYIYKVLPPLHTMIH